MKEMDIESLLFGATGGQRTDIVAGDLLIAEPLMEESIFRRSVVMVLDADIKKGYMGLVLNHQTPLSMRDLIPDWTYGERIPLFAGGPVDLERLFVLHTMGDSFEGSREILPGLYIGAKIDEVVSYVNLGGEIDGRLRFFLGYSGWEANQLGNEVLHNTWAVGRYQKNADILSETGNDYWRREVERLGNGYRSWLTVPTDAMLN